MALTDAMKIFKFCFIIILLSILTIQCDMPKSDRETKEICNNGSMIMLAGIASFEENNLDYSQTLVHVLFFHMQCLENTHFGGNLLINLEESIRHARL